MGHETLQTRTAIKDVLPRIVVAAIAVNASLSLAGLAISTADSLSQAVMGQGVDPSQAAAVLRQLVLGSLADGGIFVVLVGGVVAVLAIVVLATYIVRLALVILLVVAAPICLVCHALPQTEGLAKLWWRAFFGALAVQVAQSLVLITALRVFLATGGPANLGHRLDRRAGRPAGLGLPVLGAGQDPRLGQPVRVLRLAGPFRREQGGPRRHHLQGRQGPGRRSRAVTARRSRPDRGRVRIPADVERPDKLLAGLTARQLAILGCCRRGPVGRLRRPPATSCPSPCTASSPSRSVRVAAMLALGRFEGVAADRWVTAAWRHHRAPHHLVPAPDGVPAAPAFLGRERRSDARPLRLPFAGVSADGIVDLGADGLAVICRASAVTFSLRTPAEQEALVAGFARWLNWPRPDRPDSRAGRAGRPHPDHRRPARRRARPATPGS